MKPLADASATTAWVIVGNKPFYPLYVWWLVGANVTTSLWTLASLPAFALVALAGRVSPLGARAALPLIGLADTLFSDWMFGASSGVEAFLVPCAALCALSFRAEEAWVSRGLTAAVFLAFAALRFAPPPGLHPWAAEQTGALVNLNLYSAASLTAFVGLRFASARA